MQILQNIAIEKRKNCGTQCVKILAKLSGWLNYDNLLNIWHLWIFSLYYLLNLVAMVM